ncbi:hypothetical protein CDQ84_15515 [Clostridium thermosuccinogenes]|uniref:Uncharacterized protein n=1 Tax=Clostridium thermosuccinogenes TaxID=84032 RepID=A0A2K2F944_9CLOT|nr:VanW family protein [Pseudoclostridium thermosuccinogenes]AUS98067.1 hypothetical protein CDO33_17400 [Pseudoclostridium thermosuccinogenes]PNT95267.1 hypothetical protein CDQ85_15495 [Pseudoclostridium thermosuccinogenes]PNT96297.1 hypothetical protein CDQ84_15515 [Pseudoclostridium thermosuccinogenes]
MGKKTLLVIPLLLFSFAFASCKSRVEKPDDQEEDKSYQNLEKQDIDFSNISNNSNDMGIKVENIAGENTVNIEKTIKENVYLGEENFGGLTESEAKKRLEDKAAKINKEPASAVFDKVTWTVEKEEVYGKKVNVQKTLQKLLDAPAGQKVELVVDKVKPDITSEQIEKNVKIIGSYTTVLLDASESRVNNIMLACESLDYEKVQPGEEFSFNGVLGKRTRSKGYEKAPIIKRTKDGPKKAYEIGGGICQVSSTLYNAVRECKGLKVTERHTHSKKVKYVPKGRDATVVYGYMDFRFVNNRKHPVMIRTYLKKGKLTVNIVENRN